MARPLVSPPELTASVAKDATPAQCVALWVDLVDVCEQFLLAGLRREIGPEGDLKAAYRQWYAEQREEHDRTMLKMAARLNQAGGHRAG